jgi:type III secretion control protein HpaP
MTGSRYSTSAPPAAPDPAEPARRRQAQDAAAQESARRFDLILRLSQRSDAARRDAPDRRSPRGPGAAPRHDAPLPHGPALAVIGADAQRLRADESSAPLSGVQRRRPASGDSAAGEHAAASEETGLSLPAERDDEREHKVFEELAHRVAALCTENEEGPETWSITLPIDPETLPETVLRIQASHGCMKFRFSTQSSKSVRVISQHMPALVSLLENALHTHGQIDVDLE